MTTNIIKVQFLKNGQPSGREYAYYTPEPVEVGDFVDIFNQRGLAKGIVTAINVPEAEIAPYKDKAKSIVGKSKESGAEPKEGERKEPAHKGDDPIPTKTLYNAADENVNPEAEGRRSL